MKNHHLAGKLAFITLILITLFACKKRSNPSTTETNPTENGSNSSVTSKMEGVSPTGTPEQKSIDTLYLAALNVYYWNRDLTPYKDFNPRQYAKGNLFDDMTQALFRLTRHAIDPTTGRSYEALILPNGTEANVPKYSKIENPSSDNTASASTDLSRIDENGKGNDLGFLFGNSLSILPISEGGSTTNHAILYLRIVFPGSDAKNKGLKRGDIVIQVNDNKLIDYITSDSQGRSVLTNTNEQKLNQMINSALASNSTTLRIYNRDNNSFRSVSINKTTYTSSPIIKSAVLTTPNGKKVAYMAYGAFQNLEKTKADIDRAFADFKANSADVEDFILDLRYNGGGFVDAAEHIMNKLLSTNNNGKVMFSEHYNKDMQEATTNKNFMSKLYSPYGNSLLQLSRVDFSVSANTHNFDASAGTGLPIKNIYFLVTGSTASASELVYNSLKAYANCVMIGTKTYGKPIGFFPIRIGGNDVYYSLFESRNAKDEGGYYNGISPNYQRTDNFEYDFGNVNEYYIKTALNLINGGTEPVTEARRATSSEIRINSLKETPQNNNYGKMIVNPSRLKLLK